MNSHQILLRVYRDDALIDRGQKHILTRKCLYTVDIICSRLDNIRKLSKVFSSICHDLHAYKIRYKIFALIKRYCLITGDKKACALKSLYVFDHIFPFEFQYRKLFKILNGFDDKLFS